MSTHAWAQAAQDILKVEGGVPPDVSEALQKMTLNSRAGRIHPLYGQ